MSTPLDPIKPNSNSEEPKPVSPSAPPPGPLTPDDAGSQALADALRSSFVIVKAVMVLLVIVFFASGVFTVPSQERAIVLRFGRPVGTGEEQLLGPGLHWSFPYPIDEIVRIPISQIQTVTSTTGWYAVPPGEPDDENAQAMTDRLNPAADGYTLTGDGNIIHVRATLRYRINNPLGYTLDFVNASNILQHILDNSLIHASAQYTVDQALKSSYLAFSETIVSRVRQLIDRQGLGVTIENADIYPMAPRQVKAAFNDVVTADLKRRQTISEAQSYASSNITTAVSEARVIVNNSETERSQLVHALGAEAKYFTNQLPYYRSNPELFLVRLQTESIQRMLTNAQFKVMRVDSGDKPMRVLVSPEPEKPNMPPARR